MTLTNKMIRAPQLILAACLLLASHVMHAEDTGSSEFRIKTAFLYNFARFVSWPESALKDRSEFSLCVLGNDPFGGQLDKLTGKTVHSQTLVVRRIEAIGLVHDCHLVYISEDTDHIDVISIVTTIPVLTISDADDFVEQGGHIQFVLSDNKIRFKINVAAAKLAGLSISSKLLSLASSVTGR